MLHAEQVDEPDPAVGQVKIEVAVANITFVETQIRAGKAPNPAMVPTLPAILGNGVGGTVVGVGEGLEADLLGRRVIASLDGTGGYAEFAIANAEALIDVPEMLTTEQAVALLADGRTALLLADSAMIKPGQTVLVEAAAGGVGSLLVQRARSAGARAIAAVGASRKAAAARELGADLVVDYSDEAWRTALQPRSIDVVFDGVGGAIARAAFELLRPGGRLVAYGMASGTFADITQAEADEHGVQLIRGVRATREELRDRAEAALAEAVQGRWRPLIGQTFSLERAEDAHAAIEQRATIGKTLLRVR